jgi:hypothetical protein
MADLKMQVRQENRLPGRVFGPKHTKQSKRTRRILTYWRHLRPTWETTEAQIQMVNVEEAMPFLALTSG